MKDSIQLNLSIPELNTMLEALGAMPYYKVYELIAKLQSQAQAQLNGSINQPAPATEQQRTAAHASNGVHAEA